MNPWRYLPNELRPPGNGDLVNLTWHADLGTRASVGEVGQHLVDLQQAIDLGYRWGFRLAENAAREAYTREVVERGSGVASELADVWRLPAGALAGWYDEPLSSEIEPSSLGARLFFPALLVSQAEQMQTVLTPSSYELLGPQAYCSGVRYQNPIDATVSAAGFGFKGIMSILVLIRDWRSTRRKGAAEAMRAEAEARLAISRADLAAWYVNEVQNGRAQFLQAGQLAQEASASDLQVIERLSQSDNISLELPAGLDGRGDE